MVDSPTTAKKYWSSVSKLLEQWLKDRQELILLYVAIDGLRQFTPEGVPTSVKVKAFCQLLMDYVSAGHFEVYEKLIKEAELFDDGGLETMNTLLPKIQRTTDAVITFNDIYDTDDHCEEELINLPEDLSRLGEMLADRFELEDRLVAELHYNHEDIMVS